jgi:hypothetical protein
MKAKRAVLTVVVAAVSACLLSVSPAVAQEQEQPTVEVQGAELVAKGLRVLVTVDVTCGPFERPSFQQILDVRVDQRIGQEIVKGGGSTSLICDGTTRTYEVSVAPFNPPASSGRPFKRGEALVTASTNIFNSGTFFRASDQEIVRIR